jgi:hypothetical protein
MRASDVKQMQFPSVSVLRLSKFGYPLAAAAGETNFASRLASTTTVSRIESVRKQGVTQSGSSQIGTLAFVREPPRCSSDVQEYSLARTPADKCPARRPKEEQETRRTCAVLQRASTETLNRQTNAGLPRQLRKFVRYTANTMPERPPRWRILEAANNTTDVS